MNSLMSKPTAISRHPYLSLKFPNSWLFVKIVWNLNCIDQRPYKINSQLDARSIQRTFLCLLFRKFVWSDSFNKFSMEISTAISRPLVPLHPSLTIFNFSTFRTFLIFHVFMFAFTARFFLNLNQS